MEGKINTPYSVYQLYTDLAQHKIYKNLYSSKIKFKPRQLHLAVLKYSLRLAS